MEGIDEQKRQIAADYAVSKYGAGYSYTGLLFSDPSAGDEKKWYCTELTVKALEEGGVTFYGWIDDAYVNLIPPVLPAQVPYYRTTTGSNSAWPIKTVWGTDPLTQTWPR